MAEEEDDLTTQTQTAVVTLDTEQPGGGGRAKTDSGVYDVARIPRGAVIGDYVVGRRIGGGESGTVYVARHGETARRASVKVLCAELSVSPQLVQWFTHELRTLSRRRHPNIIDIYELGQLGDGRPYYVMELLTGMNLTELLKIHTRMAPLDVLDLIDPVLDALSTAHEDRIIHGNIKSNNVMVVEEGDSRTVKLLDFAITRLVPARGLIGLFPGSPEAAAPEQLRGEPVTVRTDIYAVGVLLFKLLTGENPFSGPDDSAVIHAHLSTSPPRPSQLAPISSAIDGVVLRCLEKDPTRRYDSMASLRSALHKVLAADKQAAAGRPEFAVVYLALRAGSSEEDKTVHNDLLRGVMMCLDDIEDQLREAGYSISNSVLDGVLGSKRLGSDPAAVEAERLRLVKLACTLYLDIENHPSLGDALDVRVVLCCDSDIVQSASGDYELPRRLIERLRTWGAPRKGVVASPDIMLDLTDSVATDKPYIDLDPEAWE